MPDAVITVSGLRKSYGGIDAVKGIDLEVAAGEVFAFLGPNGAGKTTTVEILEGYRGRSGGEVQVLGVDPGRPTRAWRNRIGIVLQSAKPGPYLTVRETVTEYAGFYPAPSPVQETVDRVGLSESADKRVGKLSGGQQRRLDVALALVGDPELIFLDEPTTGFDPSARRSAWELIAELRGLGKTVFLTTHYMDEAQELADRVAIIRDGLIVAEGDPRQLGGRDTRCQIRFTLPAGASASDLPLPARSERDGRIAMDVDRPVQPLNALTSWAIERGYELPDLEVETRGNIKTSTYYVPGLITLGIISTTFLSLAIALVVMREDRVLKRLRGTPLPAWAFIAGRVATAFGLAVALTIVLLLVGRIAYGVSVPSNTIPAVVLGLFVGAAAFSCLGFAYTTVVPNEDAAPAMINAVVLPLYFISGVFFPTDDAPGWLNDVASVFPVKHLAEALLKAFEPSTTGAGIEWGHLGIVAAWGMFGLLVAVRWFRWTPRGE